MKTYDELTREDLVRKLQELESLLDALHQEKNSLEMLNFPWAGSLGTWTWYYPTNRVLCNDAKIQALGYCREDLPDEIGFEFFTSKLHPDDHERTMQAMRDHLYGEAPVYEVSYRIQTIHKNWLWFYDRGKLIQRDAAGRPELVSGIVFDITEQKRMEQMLEQQNRLLMEMSAIDYLTNVFNRRALVEKLDYEMRRAHRGSRRLSVVLLDIDHFKRVNDTYGHVTGDRVLQQVAQVIKRSVRNTDLVGRYGGEEFLVVLPDCPLSAAIRVAEKIRQGVQDTPFDDGLQVTISAGLAEYANETTEQLIMAADRCLYEAKARGRNRVVAPYTPPLSDPLLEN